MYYETKTLLTLSVLHWNIVQLSHNSSSIFNFNYPHFLFAVSIAIEVVNTGYQLLEAMYILTLQCLK